MAVRAEEARLNGEWGASDLEAIAGQLKHLTPTAILQIDRVLEEVGPFGRVTLVKKDGRYRFIEPTPSIDAQV